MTIDREDRMIAVVCDICGERLALDVDADAQPAEIANEMLAAGWTAGAPQKVRFPGAPSYSQVFADDRCADCSTNPSRPTPLTRAAHIPPRITGDRNDPCDEWPRAAIWQALGLHPACGHPHTTLAPGRVWWHCDFCRAGYPAGRVDTRWQR